MNPVLHSSRDMTWTTPEYFLELVRQVAPIEYDPATSRDNMTGAEVYSTPEGTLRKDRSWGNDECGLQHYWTHHGLVFCNPPYGRALGRDWAPKMAAHTGEGLYLVPARTDTMWWHSLYAWARVTCLWKGRIRFGGAKDGAPFPSSVFYKGPNAVAFRRAFGPKGILI